MIPLLLILCLVHSYETAGTLSLSNNVLYHDVDNIRIMGFMTFANVFVLSRQVDRNGVTLYKYSPFMTDNSPILGNAIIGAVMINRDYLHICYPVETGEIGDTDRGTVSVKSRADYSQYVLDFTYHENGEDDQPVLTLCILT